VEQILDSLDQGGFLFPQFGLVKKENNELELLGRGGFSGVYGMYNRERPDTRFALKVTGFERHTVSPEEFQSTARIQWILCQDSRYIVRILGVRELLVWLDDGGSIARVTDAAKESWEQEENALRLQLVLLEQLDPILEKNRFGKAALLREGLKEESGVLTFALEIGQAISAAHSNCCLHRDIKLENIFWDGQEQVYKLGDFGIAKYTEDGSAETIVYTDGYGAPEIERRLYDSYHAAADIYSFGITLYLLLNDLKFPGSEGYYSKVEVQYSPDFVFPAPEHASEAMTRVIRKMCAFREEDRYQSAAEVMMDLAAVSENTGNTLSPEMMELVDIATETYREEKTGEADAEETKEERPLTRAERKEEERQIEQYYREESIPFFLVLPVLFVLLFKGMQPDASMVGDRMFWSLPAAVLFEALLQKRREFHLIFGVLVVGLAGVSMYSLGVTMPHLVLLFCVLAGCPLLSLSGALATGAWIGLSVTGGLQWLDFLGDHNLGWIILVLVLFAEERYFRMRSDWEKNTEMQDFLGKLFYDKVSLVMIAVGTVLLILQKCGVLTIPDLLVRMHMIRTGILSLCGMVVFYWWDEVRNDKYLDE
jgi:serine/threonine protein kinase